MSENLFNSVHKATNEKYREGYDAVFGKNPVIHEQCGGVAFYNASATEFPIPHNPWEFIRVDGTSPKPGDIFNEKCGSCGERIGGVDGQKLKAVIFVDEADDIPQEVWDGIGKVIGEDNA